MSSFDKNVRPPAGLETASRGRLRLVEPPQVSRKMALTDTFPDDSPPPLLDGCMAEIRRRSAELSAGTATTIPRELVRVEAIPDTLPVLTKRS